MVMSVAESRRPYFPRENIRPPGALERYDLLNHEDSLSAVENAIGEGTLTRGSGDIAMGLLRFGGTQMFPGGAGLLYNHVFKHSFNTKYARQAVLEAVPLLKDSNINCILAPEHSSAIPAGIISAALGDIPIIKVRKNGEIHENPDEAFAVEVDSYTGGERDILMIERDRLIKITRMIEGDLNALLCDEIIDAGTMTLAIRSLVSQATQIGIPIGLKDIFSLMGKGYTGAVEKIKTESGIQPKVGLMIEDLGIGPSWISIPGVKDKALTFYEEKI